MNLIALLLGLFLETTLTQLLHLRELRWFDAWFDWGLERLNGRQAWAATAGAVLLALLPVLPVALLVWLFKDVLFGLPYLAFAVLTLLFSLGPRNLSEEVDDYLVALKREDEQAYTRVAKELAERDLPESGDARIRVVEEAIYVQANNRLFGVIAWFVLLGPLGAWMFRVTDMMRRRAVFEAGREASAQANPPPFICAAERVHGVLAWLPARLLALGYALAGSFDGAIADWRLYDARRATHFYTRSDDVLACVGVGACHGEMPAEGAPRPLLNPVDSARGAMSLVNRALLIWLTGIAVLTIFGSLT